MSDYLPRVVDNLLAFRLKSKGAVLINGPKGCGKTTTAKRFAGSSVYMQDKESKEQNIALAKISPSIFLEGKTPLLIDEWQVIPFIWNQIRHEVDKRDKFGQFILAGSRLPKKKKNERNGEYHTGTGRIVDLVMRPMSLYESQEGDGSVSLKALFDGETYLGGRHSLTLRDYAFLTARGGWPKAVGKSDRVALQQAIDYYDNVVRSDMSEDEDERKINPDRVRLLMRSYARNCATEANLQVIRKDMLSNDADTLSDVTIRGYINTLERIFVVEESEAWNPNVRSKTAIRTSNTRYFIDPSIATAALGLGPDALIKDLRTFGYLFENLCVRDMRIYADTLDGTVKHFRNAKGREADIVITLRDGRWALMEVKLGGSDSIDEGAKHLIEIADDVDERLNKPSFLAVITAGNISYRREDGVYVLPLGALKP